MSQISVVLAVSAVVTAGIAWLVRPLRSRSLESQPRPAASYDEALGIVAELRGADTPAIAAKCRTILMTHGRRTDRAVVLLHGLTNCPAQFESIGRACYEAGANVLIPRIPRHGFADRMTDELARSDVHDLCRFTDRAVDAGHGLGSRVTVVGLSLGGVLAAWAAQKRLDAAHAVLIAPMLSVVRLPGSVARLVARLFGLLPNFFV